MQLWLMNASNQVDDTHNLILYVAELLVSYVNDS